jgi:hypothetical protein
MKSPEYYKGRAFRAAEHAFVKDEGLNPARLELQGFAKAVRFFELLKKFVPEGLADDKKYRNFFRDISLLPIDPKHYRFRGRVGSGRQSDVFLLEDIDDGKNSLVLKLVYSGTHDPEKLTRQIDKIRAAHETIQEWYRSIPNFIPEQHGMIIESLQRLSERRPAIAIVQKFMGASVRDAAEELPISEWKRLVKEHPHLLKELKDFLRITKMKLEETGNVVDIPGKRNLSLARVRGEPHLAFLDSSDLFKFDDLNQKQKNLVRERMRLLEEKAAIEPEN